MSFFRSAVCLVLGVHKTDDPVQKFATSGYATATTPDRLIAAAIIASFSSDPDDWEHKRMKPLKDRSLDWKKSYVDTTPARLINSKKELEILIKTEPFKAKFSKHPTDDVWTYKLLTHECTVNGSKFDEESAIMVIDAWFLISAKIKKANEVAALVKKAMEENEKKWNLAETLLNMRRDANGRLVSIHSPTPVIEIKTEVTEPVASITKSPKRLRSGSISRRGVKPARYDETGGLSPLEA